MCILILFTILLFQFLPSVISLQPFLHTDLDYASSPIDMKNLIVLESHIVYQMLKIIDKCDDNSYHCPIMDRVNLEM
jgi:hypothetical protein